MSHESNGAKAKHFIGKLLFIVSRVFLYNIFRTSTFLNSNKCGKNVKRTFKNNSDQNANSEILNCKLTNTKKKEEK